MSRPSAASRPTTLGTPLPPGRAPTSAVTSRRSHRVSWIPFGLEEMGPRHYREMAKILWENRKEIPFAWRILNQGVCDGCALGTTGMRDWTIEGTHLCMVRLELLSLNTMPALDLERLSDVEALRGK